MEENRVRNFIRTLKINVYTFVGGIGSLIMGLPKLILMYFLRCLAFITGSSHESLFRGLRRRGAAVWAIMMEFCYMLFQIERGDTYIDELLKEVFQSPVIYDPYKIPDRSFRINKKMLSENVGMHVQLFNGYIGGLQTLKRLYESLLTRQDEELTAKVDLRAGPLTFIYSGKVKCGAVIRMISVVGSLKYVDVDMEFAVNSNTGKNGELHKFSVCDMQAMTFTVSGLGPLKWTEEVIIRRLAAAFESLTKTLLQNEVARRIDELLRCNKFPVEGNDTETDTDSESDETNPSTSMQESPSATSGLTRRQLPRDAETDPAKLV